MRIKLFMVLCISLLLMNDVCSKCCIHMLISSVNIQFISALNKHEDSLQMLNCKECIWNIHAPIFGVHLSILVHKMLGKPYCYL